MGCGASANASNYEPLPSPADGPCSFVLKWTGGISSGSYSVMNKDKKKWLSIVGTEKKGFSLETLGKPKEYLAKCMIAGSGLEKCKNDEWKGDSDKSDFSDDELFNFKSTKSSMKVRWRYTKSFAIQDAGGTTTCASMKFKMKGKCKSVKEADDNYASQSAVATEALLKKVYNGLNWEHGETKPMSLTTSKGWDDYNKKWSCENFDVTYQAITGVDEVFVESKKGNFAENLMTAFAIAYFMHPAALKDNIETELQNSARDMLV